ncbi:cbl-interacting protein kinase 13 [Hordeum vulgare]|uniref:GRF-type domain-containing protein n=1 Tax=Hordeum vulgare subsp. vulgare TaxID=112509 RepID=A0A8I6WGK7_HORVV|nr:cbl-interacting protein kinase 13 [Hordeum vulgare]
MVSSSEGSSSSWDDDTVTSQLPRTIPCYELSGIAHELSSRCMHLEPCLWQVTFQSTNIGRGFLACAKEKAEEKCCYLEWIDPEWSVAMQFCICQLWRMHDKENEDRMRDNLNLGEENFKIVGEKRRMEDELRFFKLDFAKMVVDKEEAISQLGSVRLAISNLKDELEKKKLADHSSTNLHLVLRAKAQKERDELVLERDQMKEEKKKLEHIISDMMKHYHGYKDKVKKLKEICHEF